MMKCWLAEWLDFLFPVEQDMEPEKPAAPSEIPPMFRAEPLVQEAEKLVRSRR